MKRTLILALLMFAAMLLGACNLSAETASSRLPDSLMLCIGGYDNNEYEYVRQVVMKRNSVSWVDMDGDINYSTEPCLVKWDFYHPPPPGGDDTEWRITCSVGETVYYDAPAHSVSAGKDGIGPIRWIEHQTGRLYWSTMSCHLKVTGP